MHPKQAVALGVRLFAIWVFITLITRVPGNVALLQKWGGDVLGVIIFVSASAILLVVCVVLWLFPVGVAGKLLPDADNPPAQPSSADEWFSVGCRLLGLWTVVDTLPSLFFYYLPVGIVSKHPDMAGVWHEDYKWSVASLIAEVVLGIWLLLGARGLLGLLRWARSVGQ